MKKMYSILTIFLLINLICGLKTASAETVLVAGDIAFMGYNNDANTVNDVTTDKDIAFVLLRDITAGTEIYFTDAGWRSDANAFQSLAFVGSCPVPSNSGAVTDGVIKWTATSDMAFGSQVAIRCQFSLTANVGTVTAISGTYNSTVVTPANPDEYLTLTTAGETIFAYQGSFASPTLIGAINLNAVWDATLTLCEFTSTKSVLPAALSTYNQVITPETDNGAIKFTELQNAIATGTKEGAWAILSASANWDLNDATAFALPLASVLPVKLVSFTGKVNSKNTIDLQWEVALQSGIQQYVIEKSSDGVVWNEAGIVPANDLEEFTYNFTYVQNIYDNIFFRLKIIEDLKTTWSHVIKINSTKNNTVVIYPVPAKNQFTIYSPGNELLKTKATITDLNGKTVMHFQIVQLSQSINIEKLSPGIYTLHLADGSANRIIKQ